MTEAYRLLSEQESADLVHVSVETIRKYSECGLLDPIVRENDTLYDERDIRTIFYGRISGDEARASSPDAATPPLSAPLPAESESQNDQLAASTPPSTAKPSADAADAGLSSGDAAPGVTSPGADRQPTQTNGEPSPGAQDVERDATTQSASTGGETREEVTPRQVIVPEGSNFVRTTLPASNELLEMNKGLREQIEMLREERDWLRERVEKLESRSEREQMLLLSESENLRSAMSLAKSSFWKRALPWLSKE